MDYFEKIEENPYKDLLWNVPEQQQGTINIIGGNKSNFRTEIKIAEFLNKTYPVRAVNTVLPESLKKSLPPLPDFVFVPATSAGTFDESQALYDVFNTADANLVLGDFSKNSITGKALTSACTAAEKMTLITRDSVDLISENHPDKLLMNEEITIFASVVQLSKLLRVVYYPKMLLMSQSLVQVAEVLHKFTLSYPVSIVTLHNGQILVAENGLVKAVALEKSGYSPVMIWNGELAAKIVALDMYNPNNFIKATVCAIFE